MSTYDVSLKVAVILLVTCTEDSPQETNRRIAFKPQNIYNYCNPNPWNCSIEITSKRWSFVLLEYSGNNNKLKHVYAVGSLSVGSHPLRWIFNANSLRPPRGTRSVPGNNSTVNEDELWGVKTLLRHKKAPQQKWGVWLVRDCTLCLLRIILDSIMPLVTYQCKIAKTSSSDECPNDGGCPRNLQCRHHHFWILHNVFLRASPRNCML